MYNPYEGTTRIATELYDAKWLHGMEKFTKMISPFLPSTNRGNLKRAYNNLNGNWYYQYLNRP